MDLKQTRILRLEQFIERNGGQTKVSDKFNVNASYLSQLINGHGSFGEKAARKLENTFGLKPYYLDEMETNQQLANYNVDPIKIINTSVPLLSSVQAGAFKEAIEFDWSECERITTDAKIKEKTFALKVKGDSMISDGPVTFPEGTLLIIEPDMAPISGDFVIAKNGDNEATFKQLIKDGADWYLKPLNKHYPIKPANEIDIVGVVIQAQLITKLK